MRPSNLCVFCGTAAATNDDHVIPKCLFPKPRPKMVTVSACLQCNRAKARDDAYLRDLLVSDIGASGNRIAMNISGGPMLRAARSGRSEIGKAIITQGRVQAFYHHGVYLGDAPAIPVDGDRVTKIFHTIVRGLYFQLAGNIFPANSTCEVRRCYGHDYTKPLEAMRKTVGCNGPYRLADNIFEC